MSAAPARMLPQAGVVVGDKYEIVRAIGEGGMGVVYEAQHRRLGQRVALKFLLPRLVDDEFARARFEREARNASALRSPYTARIFDVDQTADGIPFIVCELLSGQELYAELKDRGALPIEEAVDYVVQACIAMAEAHALGIVHRDLKPSNLFLANQGKGRIVKVLDFGISKGTAGRDLELTTTGVLVGSPKYMSPEQVNGGKDLDARADIWSLGVIAFHALTAAYPFDGENLTQVALAVTTRPPRSLRELRPEVPEALEAAILRALEKDRSERWQTVTALARALLPFASARMSSALSDARLSSSPPPILLAPAARKVSPEQPTVALPPEEARSQTRRAPTTKRRAIVVAAIGAAAMALALGLARVGTGWSSPAGGGPLRRRSRRAPVACRRRPSPRRPSRARLLPPLRSPRRPRSPRRQPPPRR